MKNILIIGGLGFIGSNLAHSLIKKGYNVTIVDAQLDPYGWNLHNIEKISKEIKYIKGDIRDKACLINHIQDKDIIFNLAGQVSRLISLENP